MLVRGHGCRKLPDIHTRTSLEQTSSVGCMGYPHRLVSHIVHSYLLHNEKDRERHRIVVRIFHQY